MDIDVMIDDIESLGQRLTAAEEALGRRAQDIADLAARLDSELPLPWLVPAPPSCAHCGYTQVYRFAPDGSILMTEGHGTDCPRWEKSGIDIVVKATRTMGTRPHGGTGTGSGGTDSASAT